MFRSLDLHHFRNIDSESLVFQKGINALVGNNGQGKTNVLEAIYYLALLRSFRTSQINDLRQWKNSGFGLSAICSQGDLPETRLDVQYGVERRLLVNGTPIYRTSQFINSFICVTLIPQDMELIHGTETLRRRFLDIAISQFSAAYLHDLQTYNEALRSRNALLKDRDKFPRKVISAYDHVLVESGVRIEIARREYTAFLNEALQKASCFLIEDGRLLSVKYLSGIGPLLQETSDDEQQLREQFTDYLSRTYDRDCREGFTHAGPQRSALSCLLDDAQLSHFGSEGECRMASLALKFAGIDVLERHLGIRDITLLVDDVIGELDARRQENFFTLLQASGQVIMAGTYLPACFKGCANVYKVVGGHFELS